MKKQNILNTILLILLLINISCNQFSNIEKPIVKGINDSLYKIYIPKAACKNCKLVVEKGLSKLNGIKESQLDLGKKELSIIYNPLLISPKSLELIVTNLSNHMPCK
jgi:hypothetical protein